MNLDQLFGQLAGEIQTQPPVPATPVTGLAYDSRKVQPGHVFFAMKGEKADGHDFAAGAVERGAAAVVAERPVELAQGVPLALARDGRRALALACAAYFGHPSRHMSVVGVTGTNGKTTTCQLIRAAFEAGGQPCGVLGTLGCDTGARLIPTSMTTPEAVEIQGFLAEMLRDGVRNAVMEVSSHALCQRRVDGMDFRVGVFTQLTQDHLDYHKTMEGYRDAKAILFQLLPPASFAVLNADEADSAYFAERTQAQRVWYGWGGERGAGVPPAKRQCDVYALNVEASLKGIRFLLATPTGEAGVSSRMVGEHNVSNALAAAAACHACGLDAQAIAAGISAARPVDGRLDPVDCGQPFDVLVDYAHTPHALQTVLNVVRPHVKGRIILVFGAGGDRDRGKRPLMGGVAEQLADLAWVTSDNPRSEDPVRIIGEILAGVGFQSRFHAQPDRELAIGEALAAARPGDAVLIAGKGHETVQIFRDKTTPFDDRDVAKKHLKGMFPCKRSA